ncbi:lysylphosphatidylglycerol synthase transmembrane domain-containing protein [Demequina aurantiaca]|uniref:lysylphosphatidylglycerol synthase transmembrane domain-containing protein n=1 Tax=Demequina aurantiaca TaxID=676200 RepID=UPI00078152B0|nr:lysylphosphatidylglycerol synthase transmembrane domain-containing protein [Demequina aurantiaca]
MASDPSTHDSAPARASAAEGLVTATAVDGPAENTVDAPTVQIIDTPEVRVHRFSDLLASLAAVLGVVLVLLIGAFAHETTIGLSEDISGFSAFLQRLLVAPVNVFSGIVTLVVPALVLGELALRKEPRRMLEVLGAAVLAFIATVIATATTEHWGATELLDSLSVPGAGGVMEVQLPAYISAVAAMLTAAGRRTDRKMLSASWNILWIALAVAAISGIVTVPAAVVTVLIGRAAGLLWRYALGSTADRAYGDALADGIRRAGYEPKRLVRADGTDGVASAASIDRVSTAMGRTRQGRVYELTTVQGHQLLVIALDGDRQAAGFFAKWWKSIRLRGINARADVGLRHTAEATALVSHAARTAGVRTARVLGMSHVRDTMLLIYQRPLGVQPLADLPTEDISDELLDTMWKEVEIAHHAGISHRSLSSDTMLVGTDDATGDPIVWLTSWELGEVASSTLAWRIDRAQILAMTAVKVGAERAVDAAFRNLSTEELEQSGPLLQSIALPSTTRHEIKQQHGVKVLQSVREAIVDRLPDADVEQENIARFGVRQVVMISAAVVAIYLVLGSFNTESILDALRGANFAWLAAAFMMALLTFVGAALAMAAFSPIKLPWTRVLLAQVAAAYVALVAPAGVGPAALNLRLLTKRKVPTPLAVATVALVQVSAVVVTVLGLIILTLASGSQGTLTALPSTSVLVGIGAVVAVVALALLVPKVRSWVAKKIMPMVRQTWPRLVQVLGQPWRLVLGLGGNLLMTVAYVAAFQATLLAFGQHLAIVDVAVVYLLGNAAGALIPTPGGIGTIDAALAAGLTTAGLDAATALSVALIFRLLTYWARIPLGFFAMKWMEKKGEL